MRTMGVREAKRRLATILHAVEAGEEIVLTRAGRPVARLTRIITDKRPIGIDDGKLTIPADFDQWIPEEIEPYL